MALAVFLGDVNLTVENAGSLRKHISELDTHTDTCVIGWHALITECHDRVVNVSGYDTSKEAVKNLEIVNVAITVDNVDTGESHILIINQAVHAPTMDHNLLCPTQMKMHSAIINDTPKSFLNNPKDDDHCVLLQNEELEKSLRIPLTIKGVSPVFLSRKTTEIEFQMLELFVAISNSPLWDPHNKMFCS